MARESTGQVVERKGKRGITYAARVRADGERHYLTLGHAWTGYTRRQAETELQNILADIRRGTWTLPQPQPAAKPLDDPTFHEFSSQWFEARRHEVAARSVEDYRWGLTRHLLPFFKDHHLTQITIAEVDRYKTAKARERERRKDKRSLSNGSINETLNLLAQILEHAVEYGHIQFNPARGRRRRLKATQPKRTWLEPEQVKPLLDATVRGLRGGKTMPDPKMHVLFATAICTGLRIGELLALRWQDVNLAQGRLIVIDSKTEAGAGREIDLWPELHDELTTYKAGTPYSRPGDYVFSEAVMPEGSPRWIALTTATVVAVAVGIFALIAERSLFGYVILIVGTFGFATIWTLRRAATQQALRAIAWAIIWFATGGGGPWSRR
jgi:integrase